MKLPGIESRRWRVVIPAAAAVAFAIACVATAPAVASGWSIEATPHLAGPPSGGLSSVSCPSAKTCFAVGSLTNKRGTQRPLAEVRSGGAWAKQPTPNLARKGALNGVSCTSATVCTAVGDYVDSSGAQVTVAEHWDGTAWSIRRTPRIGGASSSVLDDVSCTSASACIAVGQYVDGSGTVHALAEAWNGAAWSILPSPASDGALTRVSCSAADACTALSGGTTSVERWNGSKWSSQTVAIPPSASSTHLDGVACTGARLCTAVGNCFYCTYEGGGTLAERWNGSAWAIQRTPRGSLYDTLYGVSCTSATACIAVGSSVVGTLAERWNGKSWSAKNLGSGGRLVQVSCMAAANCTAVGGGPSPTAVLPVGGGPLAEKWNGSNWTAQQTPRIPPGPQNKSFLSGVSCTSAAACTAIGNYTNVSGAEATLAEDWNGLRWAQQPTPNPSLTTGSSLSSVSCTTTTACTAVGADSTGDGNPPPDLALAEGWDGTRWSRQPTPSLGAGYDAVLSGVSCTSASACMAVGYDYYNQGPQNVSLAEGWNGTAWKILPTPPTGAYSSTFTSVSCAAATACIAVGNSSGLATFAEQWNGSSWTILPSPGLATVSSVSCPAADACVAIGETVGDSAQPAAVAWNGSAWTDQTVPLPADNNGGYLFDVSCASASDCVAVGDYNANTGANLTLAERWDGTSWSIETTPNPTGLSYLSNVSCTTTTACTAVGHYQDNSNRQLALVERYSG